MYIDELTKMVASEYFNLTGRPMVTMSVEEYGAFRKMAMSEMGLLPIHEPAPAGMGFIPGKPSSGEAKETEVRSPPSIVTNQTEPLMTEPNLSKPKKPDIKSTGKTKSGLALLQSVSG